MSLVYKALENAKNKAEDSTVLAGEIDLESDMSPPAGRFGTGAKWAFGVVFLATATGLVSSYVGETEQPAAHTLAEIVAAEPAPTVPVATVQAQNDANPLPAVRHQPMQNIMPQLAQTAEADTLPPATQPQAAAQFVLATHMATAAGNSNAVAVVSTPVAPVSTYRPAPVQVLEEPIAAPVQAVRPRTQAVATRAAEARQSARLNPAVLTAIEEPIPAELISQPRYSGSGVGIHLSPAQMQRIQQRTQAITIENEAPAPRVAKIVVEPKKPVASIVQDEVNSVTKTSKYGRLELVVANAKASIRHNDFDAAELELKTIAELAGTQSMIYKRMAAYLLMNQGHKEAAAAAYREIYDVAPYDLEAGYNLTLLDLELGRTEQAKNRIQYLKEAFPQSAEIEQLASSIKN